MKKILSIILAILMIATSVPFAFAAERFKITHQPTIDDLYVGTNDEAATYQWHEISFGFYLDDTCAYPYKPDADFENEAYYDDELGWVPAYRQLSDGSYEMYFFCAELLFGETVTFEFSSDKIDEIYVHYLGNHTSYYKEEITADGNIASFRQTHQGDHALSVVAKEIVTVKARSDSFKSELLEGETSAQLQNVDKIKDGNIYVCEVNFSDGRYEVSDRVLAHQHTGTEFTCMGCKCTVCGVFFGEEKADHSFTSYVVTTEPTTKRDGTAKAVCDYECGATDIRKIPALAAKDEIDVVYDDEGNRTGFKTIIAGGKIYYDIFDGESTLDGRNTVSFYKSVLDKKYNGKDSILSTWAKVAEKVFRIGGQKFGYNWQFGDFDKWYNTDLPNTSDNKEENADVVLRDQFASMAPYSSGEPEKYNMRATGLQYYGSMKDVEDMMLDEIVYACGEEKVADEFKDVVLEFCTPNGDGLELLQDDTKQHVLAQIITNQYDGELTHRWFSSFGVAYYDFKLTPIINENLQYISAADNYESVKDAFENNAPGVYYSDSGDGETTITYIQNPTSASTSVSASTSKSTTNSVSNSFSESESHSFSESVEVNNELTILENLWKLSLKVGFSASQAISTAYSEDKSLSETISTSSSVSVNLPAYTELGIKQTVGSTEETVEYNCPVAISYKVAIFGINGEYYQGGGTGSWSTATYDQGSICVGFGTDSSVGGKNAGENLYKRLDASNKAFELSYGNVTGMAEAQEDGRDPISLNYLDWESVNGKADLLDLAEEAMNYVPMSSMGGKISTKTESINTEITSIYPMYDLKRIRFEDSGAYTLGIGGKLDLNSVNTVGLNQFDREYYGYLPRMGTWYVCDKDGNDVTYEEGKGISLEPTPSTQTIIAHEIGEYYVRFDIDEEYYTKAVDRKTYITNDDLEFTAILKLSVTDTGNNHTCRPGGWITYIPANCVVEGERYRNCLTCSKRMATEVIPKADHIPVETVTPATCTTDGSKTTTCLTCKAIISNEVIPAKGHGSTYAVTTVVPTCIRDGEKALYCLDCNKLIGSETIASTGHDNGVWKVDFEATPEHEGQMTKYCSTCNMALESKTFAYHTHAYTSWRTNNDGTHARNCYLCGYTEINECDYNETVTPASCLVDGETTYKCKDCSYKYSEINSYAPGHTWDTWTASADGNHSATCMVCGESETTAHVFVEYIPNNDATKDADGTKTATCVVCAAKDTIIDEGSKLVDPDAPDNDNPADGCDHMCHKEGFSGFFWKIVKFFWKLFKMNPVCECGAKHY